MHSRSGSDHDERGARGGRDRDRGYGPDDERGGLPVDETDRVIASNKVEGTAVYGLDGERLGSIYNFMVDKYSGKVEYAVMTYGGFLGMGTRYYPIPWQLLKYDTRRGGYRVDLTTRDLERAPSFDRSNEPKFDRNYGQRVHNWYGLNT
jgi:sporulation protein YlmC with PRC-barrel domain